MPLDATASDGLRSPITASDIRPVRAARFAVEGRRQWLVLLVDVTATRDGCSGSDGVRVRYGTRLRRHVTAVPGRCVGPTGPAPPARSERDTTGVAECGPPQGPLALCTDDTRSTTALAIALARQSGALALLPPRVIAFYARVLAGAVAANDTWSIAVGARPAELAQVLEAAGDATTVVEVGTGAAWTSAALALAMPGREVYSYDIEAHPQRERALALLPAQARRRLHLLDRTTTRLASRGVVGNPRLRRSGLPGSRGRGPRAGPAGHRARAVAGLATGGPRTRRLNRPRALCARSRSRVRSAEAHLQRGGPT